MTRRIMPLLAWPLLAAAQMAAQGGEQPGPGLEIFDSGAEAEYAAPVGESSYQPETPQARPSAPAPAPEAASPHPYFVPDSAPDSGAGTASPYPYFVPGSAAEGGDVANQAGGGQGGASGDVPAGGPSSPSETLASLNVGNPEFPGLGGAAARGDLAGAARIVWQTLRERRLVEAVLAQGPKASSGAAPAYAYQAAFAAISREPLPGGEETPLLAAERVNVILDAFSEPVIDSPELGAAMGQALTRLHADIRRLREALAGEENDSAWLEMSRTYVRAAVTCDFFVFGARETAQFGNRAMPRAARLFNPDGSSLAGDTGGITGNLFKIALALDDYGRDDARFRREISPVWRTLERPARYLADIALPDGSLPSFGPRGSRELTPAELARLRELFPPRRRGANPPGLAASQSYPEISGQESYGGLFVSRDGAGSASRYLAVRFGPRGALPGVPVHQDFGSLSLMARGVRFLVDGGGYGGEAAGGGAHSVLSLDGEYASDWSGSEPGRPVESVWRTNAALDYAADRAAFPDGREWQRTLIYVKNLPGESLADYWLVLDQIDAHGDARNYQARIRFQLAPGIQAYQDGSGILASASYLDGPALRILPVDPEASISVSEGPYGLHPSQVYDAVGGAFAAPAADVTRSLAGDGVIATLLQPAENHGHRPLRLERDADLVGNHAGAVIVDHGQGRRDVLAWARPGSELLTPTLNLQMSADFGVFRLRNDKFVRINFVNLERFQAKEPDGGVWSMRTAGAAQTLTLEPTRDGDWRILSDPANPGAADLREINLGPAIGGRRLAVKPGELRRVSR